MRCVRTSHRLRPGPGRAAGALLLAALFSAVPCTACTAASSGRLRGDQNGRDETAAEAAGEPDSEASQGAAERSNAQGTAEAETERTIGGRRFLRRGEEWYLITDGRRYRVLPDSLSLRFRDQATPEQRQEFLDARGFAVVRRNRLGIHDVKLGAERHAVEWLGELAGHELLELVEVNTEGVYEEG